MTQFLGGLDSRMPQFQTSVLDDDAAPRFGGDSRNWNYRRRNNTHHFEDCGWLLLWPATSMQSGDLSAGYAMMGQDSANSGSWGASELVGRGNGAQKVIIGRCLDSVGTAVSGAIVQGFVTATDAYVGETACDSFGNYELGTTQAGVAHYLVAYRAGPDIAGTTVNTLVPTNRDGT